MARRASAGLAETPKSEVSARGAVGLAALRRILQPEPCTWAAFVGRKVAVDADNLLWSFVTAMGAGPPVLGPDGRSVTHLIGLTNRLRMYVANGMPSVWVYDGEQPKLKDATLAARWTRIEAAREAGNTQAGISLEDEQLAESKRLLTALGIPWLVAPSESDPQCAAFTTAGHTWAAITQDYDIALHGCPRAGRNLSASVKRTPELLTLEDSLRRAKLTREQLIDASILIGTDYNDGIHGVGPVKAIGLVRKHGDVHGALKAIGADMPHVDEVRALFIDHPVDRVFRPQWRAPDASAVRDILESAGMSRERGDELCAAAARLHADANDGAA